MKIWDAKAGIEKKCPAQRSNLNTFGMTAPQAKWANSPGIFHNLVESLHRRGYKKNKSRLIL